MKNGRLQCKDIPDQPILDFLYHRWRNCLIWATRNPGYENSITQAMPPNIDETLVLAKMKMLIRRGIVDGCTCGCRGDFEITNKGIKLFPADNADYNQIGVGS